MKPGTRCSWAVVLAASVSALHAWAIALGFLDYWWRIPLACVGYWYAFRLVHHSHPHDSEVPPAE